MNPKWILWDWTSRSAGLYSVWWFWGRLHSLPFPSSRAFPAPLSFVSKASNGWSNLFHIALLWLLLPLSYLPSDSSACLFLFLLFIFFMAAPAAYVPLLHIPRLGVESGLQLQAYNVAKLDLSSVTYAAACDNNWILNPMSEARDWTRMLMDPHGSAEPQWSSPYSLII